MDITHRRLDPAATTSLVVEVRAALCSFSGEGKGSGTPIRPLFSLRQTRFH